MDNDTVRMSLYVPNDKKDLKITARLTALSEKRDRSVNYLIVEAIMQYLDKQETRK